MTNQIKAVIVDDATIMIDGCTLNSPAHVGAALRSALQNDPDVLLVIEALKEQYYQGIATVIYASQRVGVPSENLRYTTADGEVVTLEQLRARPAVSSEE